MGAMSLWHWIAVIVVVLLLFGRGKAQGIKAFKKGMADDDTAKLEPSKSEVVKPVDHHMDQQTGATKSQAS
jgi:sec-independent protein translocase protein TatA